jgi:hypothetical protein
MSGLAWDSALRTPTELCRIVCESAAVVVSTFPTGNGMRLQLVSERSRASVLLDATVLEALCHLTPEAAAEIVRARTEDDPRAEREPDVAAAVAL